MCLNVEKGENHGIVLRAVLSCNFSGTLTLFSDTK